MIKYRECIKDLSAYVAGKPIDEVKKEYGIETVVKLASNESQWGASQKALAAAHEALSQITLYPDGNSTALKEAISKKYDVPVNNIGVGCGSDDILALLGKAYVEDGDECITGDITFSVYASSVESMGGKMIYVPLKNHSFDLNGILNAITDKTKIIFIANPNNPTGVCFTADEQLEFVKKVPSHIMLVFDEAYGEFVKNVPFPDTVSMAREYNNIVITKTFSKAYGLASLRVGFCIADSSIIDILNRIRGPFNVNLPAQMAAAAALTDYEFIEYVTGETRKSLDYLCQRLDELNISYIPSVANFVMIDVQTDSMEVFNSLLKEGYIVRSGKSFGMPEHIRVTAGSIAQMDGFIEKLKKVWRDKI